MNGTSRASKTSQVSQVSRANEENKENEENRVNKVNNVIDMSKANGKESKSSKSGRKDRTREVLSPNGANRVPRHRGPYVPKVVVGAPLERTYGDNLVVNWAPFFNSPMPPSKKTPQTEYTRRVNRYLSAVLEHADRQVDYDSQIPDPAEYDIDPFTIAQHAENNPNNSVYVPPQVHVFTHHSKRRNGSRLGGLITDRDVAKHVLGTVNRADDDDSDDEESRASTTASSECVCNNSGDIITTVAYIKNFKDNEAKEGKVWIGSTTYYPGGPDKFNGARHRYSALMRLFLKPAEIVIDNDKMDAIEYRSYCRYGMHMGHLNRLKRECESNGDKTLLITTNYRSAIRLRKKHFADPNVAVFLKRSDLAFFYRTLEGFLFSKVTTLKLNSKSHYGADQRKTESSDAKMVVRGSVRVNGSPPREKTFAVRPDDHGVLQSILDVASLFANGGGSKSN